MKPGDCPLRRTQRLFCVIAFAWLGLSGCSIKRPESLDTNYIGLARVFWVYAGEHDTFPSDPRGAGFALYQLRELMSSDALCRGCEPVVQWDHANKSGMEARFTYLNEPLSFNDPHKIVLVSEPQGGQFYIIDSALVTYKMALGNDVPVRIPPSVGSLIADCLKAFEMTWSHPSPGR